MSRRPRETPAPQPEFHSMYAQPYAQFQPFSQPFTVQPPQQFPPQFAQQFPPQFAQQIPPQFAPQFASQFAPQFAQPFAAPQFAQQFPPQFAPYFAGSFKQQLAAQHAVERARAAAPEAGPQVQAELANAYYAAAQSEPEPEPPRTRSQTKRVKDNRISREISRCIDTRKREGIYE